MRCLYCDSFIADYPADGICPHCGGHLPDRPVGTRCPGCGKESPGNFCAYCGRSLKAAPAVQPVVKPVYVQQPVYPPVHTVAAVPGVNCCPKCQSRQLVYEKRGFSWGLGLLGFFLFPFFGLLLGLCGSKQKKYLRCTSCRHKWKRR